MQIYYEAEFELNLPVDYPCTSLLIMAVGSGLVSKSSEAVGMVGIDGGGWNDC